MRLLINASTLRPEDGGNWTYLHGFLPAWASSGVPDELLIVAHPSFSRELEASLQPMARVERLGEGRADILIAQHLTHARRARGFAAHGVLHLMPVIPLLRPIGRPQAAVVHDIRHAVLPHEFSLLKRTYRNVVYGNTLRHADVIVTSSEKSRRDIEEHFGLPPERLRMVPLGSDHVRQWPRTTPGRHGVAFAHWSNKQPDVAIRAWAELRRWDPTFDRDLHIIGAREPLTTELHQLAEALEIGGLVVIHGHLPDDEFFAIYTSAAVILLPSTLEGFGYPVLEGMLLDIPVVASGGVGMEQAGGDAALYADPADPAAFAVHCRRLFADEGYRAEVVARGCIHAAAYTWHATAMGTRDALRDAILRRQRPRL